MSSSASPLHSSLVVRRWPERRLVVLAAAGLGFAAVLAGMLTTGDAALGALYTVPVMLAALELGLASGLAAAAGAAALLLADGAPIPAVAVFAVAAVAGRFSDRMRELHAREQRLLDSALAVTGAGDALPAAVAAAALRTPQAVGAEVDLEGSGRAAAGRMDGRRTTADVVARGARRGRIVVAHRGPLAVEDRAALDLLAVQAGLAADNQRLLEQRTGLGRLIDAQEDDRRRFADTLHEELAQVLAAALMNLRILRRHGADEETLVELHEQIRGVLGDMRQVATSLRPSSLAQLGLVPALEARDDVTVETDGLPEPLPEPLRTGVYRLLEHVIARARPGARVRLSATRSALDVVVDVEIDDAAELIGTARAQAALMGGTLAAERLPDGRSRLSVRLPLAQAAMDAGSVARTTVRPSPDSISS